LIHCAHRYRSFKTGNLFILMANFSILFLAEGKNSVFVWRFPIPWLWLDEKIESSCSPTSRWKFYSNHYSKATVALIIQPAYFIRITWASAAGTTPPPPRIFIHGLDRADRGLIVLFSVFFLLFFRSFSVGLPALEEA